VTLKVDKVGGFLNLADEFGKEFSLVLLDWQPKIKVVSKSHVDVFVNILLYQI
jgi:hypothetical protein